MTDREAVEEITRKGHTQCFAELVQRYSGMVYSKALSVVHREEVAGEVTQQTFVKAYEQLDVWRGQQMGPWLVTIALHVALRYMDKERVRRAQPVDELGDTLPDNFDNEREEMICRMEEAIRQLPKDERELIDLHYYQKKRTADIASATGLTQSNVLVKLHRIREKLREKLKAEN